MEQLFSVFGNVKIGKNVFIEPFCLIGYAEEAQNNSESAITIIGNNVEIHSHSVISQNCILGNNVWCGNYTYIGENSKIADGVELMYGAKIYRNVSIGKNSWIGGFICNNAIIEEDCVVMGTLIHKFTNAIIGIPEPYPTIRKGAFIGMNAIVIGGVEVGENAYIAAGSVLTKPAKPNMLYLGNPARCIGKAPLPFNKEKMKDKNNKI